MAGNSPDSPPSPPPSGSPNKRRKMTAQDIFHLVDQSEDGYEPGRPGAPMEEDESGSPVCGICLSEGGKLISGQIDSCDHYFCFVCILEWAKVESRCPMCKQRFTSIRRPAKLGVFASERIVSVPQRDQVYHLSGNATVTCSDPYAETHCTVCRNMTDESLLLLCDLCDSAAHTYCVGLGHTVPEGDWFCHDCAVSRAEHEKADQSVETESENFAEECVELEAADPNVSIFDIVKDTDRMSRLVSLGCGSSIAKEENSAVTETHRNLASCCVVESCARTLRRCRDVQSRIQILRDNWNSFRNGSLRFPTGSGESSAGHSKRREESSSSFIASPIEQCIAEDNHVRFTKHEKKDPYDTEKAWKMMEMAKTAQKRTGNINRLVSKAHSVDRSNTKVLSKIRSSKYASEEQQVGQHKTPLVQKIGSSASKMMKQIRQHHETDQKLLKDKQILNLTSLAAVQHKTELPSTSSGLHEYTLYKKASVRIDSVMARSSAECADKKTSNKRDAVEKSFRFPYTADPAGDSGLFRAKTGFAYPSSSKPSTEKCAAGNVERENNDAKTEIQSLVKLNLKLLTKGKPIGVNRFKEVARISTHTILAACRLEHSKPRIRPFTLPTCNHGDDQRSKLLQDVCRECFYAFATDVVRSVLREKAREHPTNL